MQQILRLLSYIQIHKRKYHQIINIHIHSRGSNNGYFENVNPEEVNKSLDLSDDEASDASNEENNVSSVDIIRNGQVIIKEAKAAGFRIPITSDHWLYQFMDDKDGDGMVVG